jgi:FKBP-type peptidyl-prolyl cis-trans isomerase FkpA
MRKYLLLAFAFLVGLSSCKKDTFDAAKQATIDDNQIREFLAVNGITATRHESGLYYVISDPGSGSLVYTSGTAVTAKYTGRFLNGEQFDSSSSATFPIGNVIIGWQIGIPLIQKGGKIRLLIPSALAYGHLPYGPKGEIPANSILDFDIELINAQN